MTDPQTSQFEYAIVQEQAVCGALLVDPRAVKHIQDDLHRSDFVDKTLGSLYALLALLAASGKVNAGDRAMIALVRSEGLLEPVGGAAGIAKLAAAGVPAHIVTYAREVRRLATLRRMQTELARAIEACTYTDTEPDEIVSRLDAVSKLGSAVAGVDVLGMGDIAEVVLAAIDKTQASGKGQGIHSGFPSIDDNCGGFFPSEVTILAARPSLGKTAFAMEIALRMVRAGRRVLFVSMEMDQEGLGFRMFSRETKIPVRALQGGSLTQQQVIDCRLAGETLSGLEMRSLFATNVTVSNIAGVCRMAESRGKIDLVIIDYLGLLKPRRASDSYERVTEISRDIKCMALELRKPVLLLHQLNRTAEKERPGLSQLRDSGAIEQDADNIWLLHRENRDSVDMELIIAKQRQGSIGTLPFEFFGGQMRIEEKGYAASVEFGQDFNDFA